jgi:Na+(H+)/acetate symporter ActP
VGYFRDVSVQAIGTVLGVVVLLIGAKLGGLLTGVDWGQVWKAVGVPVLIASVGLVGAPFFWRKDRRVREEIIARAKREGWYGDDMRSNASGDSGLTTRPAPPDGPDVEGAA